MINKLYRCAFVSLLHEFQYSLLTFPVTRPSLFLWQECSVPHSWQNIPQVSRSHLNYSLLQCCTSFHDRYLLVFCTQFYKYRHFGLWIWELAKTKTALDNNLISKTTQCFSNLFILIPVPDDVFKLQAEISRIFYTLEVLSIDLFLYNTQTAGFLTSRFCQTHLSISFLTSTDTLIGLWYWEVDLSFC